MENVQPSAPFSIHVINPVQRIQILLQPSGDVDVAKALPVQPILRIHIRNDSPSVVGQLVKAEADPSCTVGASTLAGVCTIAEDNTCKFQKLSVVGIRREVRALSMFNESQRIISLKF